jgi:hypothetical protein
MNKALGIIIIATILFGSLAHGKESQDEKTAIEQWFERYDISIRKTFDGSKSEGKPAAITWVNDSSKEDEDFYLIDLAVKVKEWDLVKEGNSSFLLYPVVEWHRNTQNDEETDKLSGALKAEYRMFPLIGFSPDNKPLPPIYPGQKLYTVSPLLLASVEYSEDLEKNTDEIKGSIFCSLTSNKRWFPGAQFRSPDGTFRGRYYPYIGVERFEPTIDEVKARADFLTARFFFEYWPFAEKKRQYLQFVFEYAYRYTIGKSDFSLDDASELTLGLNLYLDGKGNVGIGYEYVNGEDPKDGFIDRERSSIAFKVKF